MGALLLGVKSLGILIKYNTSAKTPIFNLFIFLKINKMNGNIRKNLFKLEEDEFETVEKPRSKLIEDKRKEERIKIYPEKKIKTKRDKIKVSKKPEQIYENKKDEYFTRKEMLEISAEEYPGEVVKHKNNYFISMMNDKKFEWFLLK